MNYVRVAAMLLLLGAALLATASACGGGDDDTDAVPTGASTTAPTDKGDNGGDGDGSAFTLVAKNTLWDKTDLQAKAGEITFTVDNQDGGVVHNLHIYEGMDNSGEDKGATELEAGPVTQTLTVTFEPGTYFFLCDVHPATMAGTIEVE